MNRLIRAVQSYLLYALPLVLLCMVWSTLLPESKNPSFLAKSAGEILSWNLMLWFAVLILFLVLLVVAPAAREKTLKRLANLQERDEREQYITGKAARTAYISTLSLLIFFLFISVFTLDIRRLPKDQAIDGKTGTVSIGLRFQLLDKPAAAPPAIGRPLFESQEIALSKSATLLILILWQLAAFRLAARKEYGRDQEK